GRLRRAVRGAVASAGLSDRQAPGSVAHADVMEPLESRVLLSTSSIGPIVDVVWHGQKVQAIEHQYVAQTSRSGYFSALAQQEGFTNVRSLGGNGYFGFTSDLSTDAVAKLAAKYPKALPLVEPNMVVK